MTQTRSSVSIKILLGITCALVATTVFLPTASFAGECPRLPVGTFYTSSNTDTKYVKRVALSLKGHSFNTVVANKSFTKEMVDVFQNHGIAVITYGDKFLDHPAVIGSLVGNGQQPGNQKISEELKVQYQKLSAKTKKLLIVCRPGEEMGLFRPTDPRKLWKELKPEVRCWTKRLRRAWHR